MIEIGPEVLMKKTKMWKVYDNANDIANENANDIANDNANDGQRTNFD